MKKIELPGDNWAKLRDPDEVTERQRRPLVRLQRKTLLKATNSLEASNISQREIMSRLSPEDYDALEEVDDLVIQALVDSWSYDFPPNKEGAVDLPGSARSVLLKACRPLLPRLLGATSDADVLDTESPTTPANDSDRS